MTGALEFLIRRGHGFDDLWRRYTIDQVWAFFRAAHENLDRETLDFAVSMRVAFGSDQTGWKKFVQSFFPKKLAQKPVKKASDIMPKEKYKRIRRLLRGK